MSRVAVIGSGYVGLTTAVGLATLGHDVIATDLAQSKVSMLREGECPIIEDELPTLLQKCLDIESLDFTTSNVLAVNGADFVFLCLPTPPQADGKADLSAIFEVLSEIREEMLDNSVLVMKSTVPIGTGEKILKGTGKLNFHYISNPEFLREGRAIYDFFNPDRVVIGSKSKEIGERVARLFSKLETQFVHTDITSAETIKYASNAFLATKVSFINEIATICELTGANIDDVAAGMGSDSRIGASFLKPGPGWGGSCFPKDSTALLATAADVGFNLEVLSGALLANQKQQRRIVDRVVDQLGGSLHGHRIAVLGVSFKAGTDDVRDSPALSIALNLHEQGASIAAYDPALVLRSDLSIWNHLEQCSNSQEAADGASIILVLTEWPEFAELNPDELGELVSRRIVFDTRNVLDASAWIEAGFALMSIGHK